MATINIPQIRFKGFEGEWEKKIFEDICTFGNGYTPSKAIDEYWENGTLPWYRMEDIRENGRILKDSIQHITPKAVKGKLFPANSIIMSTTATIGEHALLIADSLANQRFTFFIKNVNRYNYDDLFFFYKCYSIGEWCKKNANAGGLLAVNMPELKKLGLSFPTSISEQTRIASLFTAIDKQISTSEAKLDKLRTIKKTLLKKMFASTGEKTPKIRFKGFDGEWEEKPLNNWIEPSKEKNIDNKYTKMDVLSVSGDYGVVNQIEFQGRSFAGVSVSNYGVLHTNDIVYTKSPLKANPYGIIKTNLGKTGIVSTLYAIYKSKQNLNPIFVQEYFELDNRLNLYLRPLVRKGAKNDMKVSSEDAIKGMVIFPEEKEQSKISMLLLTLDKQISLQEQKIEKLKAVKKTLLKKMFV